MAFTEGSIIGTCAVKKRSEDKCEVKRLYVHRISEDWGSVLNSWGKLWNLQASIIIQQS